MLFNFILQSFFCPETEQEFSAYEKLMRYVRYAKAAKVSIYAPVSLSSYLLYFSLFFFLLIVMHIHICSLNVDFVA